MRKVILHSERYVPLLCGEVFHESFEFPLVESGGDHEKEASAMEADISKLEGKLRRSDPVLLEVETVDWHWNRASDVTDADFTDGSILSWYMSPVGEAESNWWSSFCFPRKERIKLPRTIRIGVIDNLASSEPLPKNVFDSPHMPKETKQYIEACRAQSLHGQQFLRHGAGVIGTLVKSICAAFHNSESKVEIVLYDPCPVKLKQTGYSYQDPEPDSDFVAQAIRVLSEKHNCDFINLSLSFDRETDDIIDAVKEAKKLGVLCVAAAGNGIVAEKARFPASHGDVVAVSGMGLCGLAPEGSQYKYREDHSIKTRVVIEEGLGSIEIFRDTYTASNDDEVFLAPSLAVFVPICGGFLLEAHGTSFSTPIAVAVFSCIVALREVNLKSAGGDKDTRAGDDKWQQRFDVIHSELYSETLRKEGFGLGIARVPLFCGGA